MKVKKLLLSLLLFLAVFPTFAFAEEYKSGDIRNSVVSASQDGITVTKKVSKTDSDYVYNVEFTIEGENVVNTFTKNVYISVVFDKSGSMLCDNGTKTSSDLFYNKAATINNQVLYCNFFDAINLSKWNNAVSGAIEFSSDIVENLPTAKLNLITFSTDVDIKGDFKNTAFKEEDFGYPNGSTNLQLAIDNAKSSLDSISEDSLKYILIISDGDPDNASSVKTSIANVKDSGIKVYTIGYDTTNNTREFLKSISSGDGFYYDANIEGLGSVLKNLATEIHEVASGSDAVMLDTLGDEFSYKSGDVIVDGNKISYNFSEISAEKITFNFDIYLKEGLATGWYATNNINDEGVVLKYKDTNDKEKKIIITSSSEVYFEKAKANYVVNYYKDSISSENFLGKVDGELEIDSILDSSMIEKDKYLPIGYNSEKVIIEDLLISDTENVVNIVYSKNKYPYHIEYYKDSISRVNLVAKTREVTCDYGEEINEDKIVNDFGKAWLNLYRPDGYKDGVLVNSNILIDVDDNVIKVIYSKQDSTFYKIEYYFNDKLDDSKTIVVKDQLIGTKIENLKFEEFANYSIQKVDNYPFTVSLNEQENIIRVYYTLDDDIVLPPNTFVDSGSSFSIITVLFIVGCFITFVGKRNNYVKKFKK